MMTDNVQRAGKVVNLADYRAQQPSRPKPDSLPRRPRRILSATAFEHRARMLQHLLATTEQGR